MPEVWFDSVAGTRFKKVRHVAMVGSTNAELMELARNGSEEGEVLIADFQSAGRGRRGRTWLAPPGTALMMSVLLRPVVASPVAAGPTVASPTVASPVGQLAPNQASLVVSAWACAAAEACELETGIRPLLKWPNDLVLAEPSAGNKKIAGILAETVLAGAGQAGAGPGGAGQAGAGPANTRQSGAGPASGSIAALVIGMGLNTGWSQIPAELSDTATSLNIASGQEVDRAQLAKRLLVGFERRYANLLAPGDGLAKILAEVRQQCVTLGSRIRVERELSAGGTLVGKAIDVNTDGSLLVIDDGGTQHQISTGEVVHLRPTIGQSGT